MLKALVWVEQTWKRTKNGKTFVHKCPY